jgi:hypothetical protein
MSEDRTALWGEILQNEADSRHDAHKDHASSRPLSEDYELIGLLGEAKFGALTGLMPDLERKLSGDNGIDFIVPLKFSVDVKTARKPRNLIQERGKVSADIYVLAGYDDKTKKVTLLGWEWGAALLKAPVKDFGYGIFNHFIPVENLKPMSKLTKRI